MLALTNTGLKVEVVLNGAITTNQLECSCVYNDIPTGNAIGSGPTGNNTTKTNGATAVTLVPAPTQAVTREIQNMTIHNADTASATVSVRLNDGTNTWRLFKATLATLETMIYSDGAWLCYTAAGEIKSNT